MFFLKCFSTRNGQDAVNDLAMASGCSGVQSETIIADIMAMNVRSLQLLDTDVSCRTVLSVISFSPRRCDAGWLTEIQWLADSLKSSERQTHCNLVTVTHWNLETGSLRSSDRLTHWNLVTDWLTWKKSDRLTYCKHFNPVQQQL